MVTYRHEIPSLFSAPFVHRAKITAFSLWTKGKGAQIGHHRSFLLRGVTKCAFSAKRLKRDVSQISHRRFISDDSGTFFIQDRSSATKCWLCSGVRDSFCGEKFDASKANIVSNTINCPGKCTVSFSSIPRNLMCDT